MEAKTTLYEELLDIAEKVLADIKTAHWKVKLYEFGGPAYTRWLRTANYWNVLFGKPAAGLSMINLFQQIKKL